MPGKTVTGRVISNKMQKTVVVAIDWVEHHRMYGKAIRRVTKLYAHDPRQECRLGDIVRMVEVRPLSKSKRWLVKAVVTKATAARVSEDLGAGDVDPDRAEPAAAPQGGPQ